MSTAGRLRGRRPAAAEDGLAVAPVPWFGRSPRRMFLLLWLVAFSHRLFLQLGSVDRSWPFPVFYEGDAETFHRFALSILAGQTYDGGIPFHPPLYPLFLAAAHALLGNPAPGLVLRIAHGAVYALSVPLLWLWMRKHLPAGAALAGALLAAWSFGLAVISTAAVSEGLYLLLLLAGLLAFDGLREAQEGSAGATRPGGGGTGRRPAGRVSVAARRAIPLGVLGGLLALTRAEGLGWSLLLLAAGGLAAWRARRLGSGEVAALPPAVSSAVRAAAASPSSGTRSASRAPVLPWAIALGALLLTLAPWTVRNAVVLSRANRLEATRHLDPLPTLVITTAYGPLNFALANHAGAPGYFTRRALTSGLRRDVLDLTDPQHRDLFLHGYHRGWDWIRRHPGDFFSLAARKVALLARGLRLGWTQWDLPGGLKGTRYPVDLVTPDSGAAVPIHLALLLSGAWLLLTGRAGGGRGRRSGRVLLAVAGGSVLFSIGVTVAFFGYARQSLPTLALLCGVEGTALASGAGWLWRRVRRFPGWTPDAVPRTVSVELPDPGDPRRDGLLAGPTSRARGPLLVAGLIVALWAIEFAGAFQNRNFLATGETQADSSRMLNRDSIMVLSPKSP